MSLWKPIVIQPVEKKEPDYTQGMNEADVRLYKVQAQFLDKMFDEMKKAAKWRLSLAIATGIPQKYKEMTDTSCYLLAAIILKLVIKYGEGWPLRRGSWKIPLEEIEKEIYE